LPSSFSNLHACTSHPTPRIICLLERSWHILALSPYFSVSWLLWLRSNA
jgi:hypothetical protein